ncbi:MAG: tetratricopeptide repeat protein [Deltaproteobacteria bacterium]|nr:tetratricopeptide repeat protein [Deltaproteobacteria bacterium]
MTKSSKKQREVIEEEKGPKDKIPLSFSLQWPMMKAYQAVSSVVDSYKKMFKIGPADLKSLYLKKYEAADRRGETWKCIRWMEKITSLDPKDPDGFYRLGIAYEKNKDIEDAINAYRQVIKIKPDHAKAHYRTGILYLSRQEFKRGVELLEKALKIEPESAEINFRLGVGYDRMQEHERAIFYFLKALEIKPDFLKVNKHMALTYDVMGKHKEAVECLKRALELEEMSA